MTDFSNETAQVLLKEYFADWVRQLDMSFEKMTDQGARFRWAATPGLLRGADEGRPGVVCGQATSAVADTLSVLTLCALNEGFRDCTTADLHINFLRPLFDGEIEVDVTALSNGRRSATTRVEFRQSGSGKLAATATVAFIYLA